MASASAAATIARTWRSPRPGCRRSPPPDRRSHDPDAATGPTAVHQALLFRQLSPHVTLLQHTGPVPDDKQHKLLTARGITTVTAGPVEAIEADASGLTGVRLADGRHLPLDAVIVAPFMRARAEQLEPLGLKPAEMRIGEHAVGTYIESDPTGATVVPGVWVAGNLANVQAQVITSAAAGLTAGAAINLDLVLSEAGQAART